jgi:ABC-type multidrug transport system fused ATPase/permease subunit
VRSRALRSATEFLDDFSLLLGDSWRRLPMIVALMLLATSLDVLGVALVAPFVSIITIPQGGPAATSHVMGIVTPAALPWISVGLMLAFALKGPAAYWTQHAIGRFTEGERAKVMDRLLGALQSRPYEDLLRRNSLEVINTIVWYSYAYSSGILGAALRMAADVLVLAVIGGFLAWNHIGAVATLLTLLMLVFAFVGRYVRPGMGAANQANAQLNEDVMICASQAISGMREVRILGGESYFRERLRGTAEDLAESCARIFALQTIPRNAVETAIVAFLILFVATTSTADSPGALLPFFATFAAAAIRLMPASTSLLSNWTSIRTNRFALRELTKELRHYRPEPSTSAAKKRRPDADKFKELRVEAVAYTYPGTQTPVLEDVSFTARAGDVIALLGRSGTGKSTLADLALGLLTPQRGRVLVNGRDIAEAMGAWHAMVVYIPQSVHLIDDTLLSNIALGETAPEIDRARLQRAIEEAQLDDLVSKLPRGLDTLVGERGSRLSGGQRQRVAIARALYYDRQFLVLDEATSALDRETEEAVIGSIKALKGKRTVLLITHNPSLTADANVIVRLGPQDGPGARGAMPPPVPSA